MAWRTGLTAVPLHSVTNFTHFALCPVRNPNTLVFIESRFTHYSLTSYSVSRKRHTMNSTFNDRQAQREVGHAARQALRAVLACALVLGASGAAFAQQHGDRDRDYAGPPPE